MINPFITKEEAKLRKLAELGDYAFALEGHQDAFTREIVRLKRDGIQYAVTKGTGKNGYAHVQTWVTLWVKPSGPKQSPKQDRKPGEFRIQNKKDKSCLQKS